nr:trehalose-6-phosphate synthase [Tomitella gaofuii]
MEARVSEQDVGSNFVVVANRLPVDLVTGEDGEPEWRRSPGGLVSALEPVLRNNSGGWVGWPGQADADVAPFVEDGLELHPVRLDSDDYERYYEGFSNGTLWPLYHDLAVKPEYHREWWESYVDVNRRFAEATAKTAAGGATVWVQDYQLQLVPRMLRELRPDLTIGFFLHIPFPPVELFMQLPWRRAVVEGMLGADLIGFQLPGGADNFMILARKLLGLPTSRGYIRPLARHGSITHEGRTVRVGAFPISIDSSRIDRLARSRAVRDRAAEIRRQLGDPGVIMLGVDRLDYTKGIDMRLRAIGELLEEGRLDPSDTVMVQLATPSRERVEQYAIMRRSIEEQVGRINGEYGEVGSTMVHYMHRPVGREELTAFFVAADVMLVTPLRDGMNLVAKEYVASKVRLDGALVLSEFAGAASELKQAYLVNPHDIDGVKNAMTAAVSQDRETGRRRMRALRRQVLAHDVDRWARMFLDVLRSTSAQEPL